MVRWGAKFDVDCPACGRPTVAREPDGLHRVFLPAALRPYSLAVCQSCGQALLLEPESEAPDTDPEELPAGAARVLWPSAWRPIAAEVPPVVGQELTRARECLSTGSPSSAVLHVRRLLEAVCQDHGVRGRTLFHALGELRRRGHIDAWLLTWAEELRELGNEAAHLGSGGRAALGRREAIDAVELAEAFVDYLYVFSRKYHEFQVRRGITKPNKSRNKIIETPAMRILRKSGIAFTVHPHPHDPAHTKSRAAVAAELGFPPGRMLKAVVVHLGEQVALAIAPIGDLIDERAVAATFGVPAARVADLSEVGRLAEAIAAEIVSPVALPYLPAVLERGLAGAPTVCLSSGRHGLELELATADLLKVTSARTAAIVK
ncbi:DUF4145 domain-containing protein [Nonomuraea sp. NPDC046570]|uniref:DUF4145 domain-containing protein n=1 Tax=Nonomuraea sp. NPDC046570 TaxID=3155255 RepID=UPI003401A955